MLLLRNKKINFLVCTLNYRPGIRKYFQIYAKKLSILTYAFFSLQKYYLSLAKQLSRKKRKQEIGENLSSDLLNCFNDEQIAQLMELHKEATIRPQETDS